MKVNLKSIGDFASRSSRHIGRSITGQDEASDGDKADLLDPKRLLLAPGDAIHTIKQEFFGVLFFVAIIWVIYFADAILPFINLNEQFALIPRTLRGLPGIFTMTFLHGDVRHLMSNTIPLIILLTLMAGSRGRSWLIVICIILTGGGILWVFGRNGTAEVVKPHVGASMLVFGLITFLIASAVIERRIIPMIIAAVVGMSFWSTLLFGFIPAKGISWDGHLCGALAGVIVAFGCAQRWFSNEVIELKEKLAAVDSK